MKLKRGSVRVVCCLKTVDSTPQPGEIFAKSFPDPSKWTRTRACGGEQLGDIRILGPKTTRPPN